MEQNENAVGQPKVVFPLHGIRTLAQWQRVFADTASEDGWMCRLDGWDFGRFSLWRFINPWARAAKVSWFRNRYRQQVRELGEHIHIDRCEYPSVVAHSFGTLILGNALLKYEYLRLNKVILCGSLLPTDFPWDRILERGQVQEVRNEFGINDVWTRRCAWIVPGTGPSGTDGFSVQHPRMSQQKFRYAHSEYFDAGHMQHHWIPFLDGRTELVRPVDGEWINAPRGKHPIASKYLTSILLAVILLFLGILMYFGTKGLWHAFAVGRKVPPENIGLTTIPESYSKSWRVPVGADFVISLSGLPSDAVIKWSIPHCGTIDSDIGKSVRYQATEVGRECISATIDSSTGHFIVPVTFGIEEPF